MAQDRTHVRVFQHTKEQLQELIDAMEDAVSKGRGNRFWKQETLGTAELIEELVMRELRHRERSRKRRTTPPAAESGLTPAQDAPVDPGTVGLTPPPDDVLETQDAAAAMRDATVQGKEDDDAFNAANK